MKKYYSNLHVLEHNQKSGLFCKGKGWLIYFDPDPSSSFVDESFKPKNEIIIYANSEERAEYVANLIIAAHCLYTGDLMMFEDRTVSPKRAQTVDEISEQLFKGGHDAIGVYHLPASCLVAAKASWKYKYQYAIFKYFLSFRTITLEGPSLDPQRDWIPGKAVSTFPKEHVFYALSISLCYSVLEELTLDIRASQKEPSKKNGRWNPVIRSDLENRLIRAGINLNEELLWTLRETPTKIERARKPPSIKKTEWAGYRVRDELCNIIDAIAYASYLRSVISSHRLPSLARSLSIYDVANVQHLARRLLLETLGFWRYFLKHPSM